MARRKEQDARYLGKDAPEANVPARAGRIVPARAGAAPRSLEWAALAVAAKEAENHRGDLPAGEALPVDVTLRIRGAVDVGGDGTSTTKTKPTPEMLLTTLLAISSEDSRQSIASRLVKLHGTFTRDKIPAGVCEMVDNVMAKLTQSKTAPRAGSITGAIEVEVVERNGKPPRGARAAA